MFTKEDRRKQLLAKSEAKVDWSTQGFDLSNPNACLQQARQGNQPRMSRGERDVARLFAMSTFNRQGLEYLVQDAAEYFEEQTGVSLPYNLGWGGPWSFLSQRDFSHLELEKWIEKEGYKDYYNHYFVKMMKKKPVNYAAHFSWWLREATRCPVLVRLIENTTSPNGVNSEYTTMDLYRLYGRFRNPWMAQRKLCSIQEAANEILRPFGLKASWRALGDVLSGTSRKTSLVRGKAARAVANRTTEYLTVRLFGIELNLVQSRGLKALKEYSLPQQFWAISRVKEGEFDSLQSALKLVERRLVSDNTDGVSLLLDRTSNKTFHGVSVTNGWLENGEMNILCVQVHKGRTYHARGWSACNQGGAALEAIKNWR